MANATAMPTSVDLPDGNTAADTDLDTALTELDRARRSYEQAEEYYEGTRLEAFASIRLRRAMAKTGDNFRLNFAAIPVDEVAERLEISSVAVDGDDKASAQLEDMWADNQLDLEGPNIHRRACEYGDAYVIVWPSDPDEDTAEPDTERVPDAPLDQIVTAGTDQSDPTAVAGGDNPATAEDTDHDGFPNVDIFYNSPQSVRLFYDPEKPLRKKFAVKKWDLTNTKQVRLDLYYPDRVERYISKKDRTRVRSVDMLPYTADGQGDENGVLTNPFGEIPVFHFRTDRPYGVPEHRRFFGAQDAIHKLIVSHMSGVDYQAFPQRYALMDPDVGDSGEAVNADEDEFTFQLDTGSTSRPGDPQSQLTSDPGSFWQLQGMRSVGQFNEADPKTFMDPLRVYLRAGAQLAKTPFHYFDPSGDSPSGESLRVAESPLVKKVMNRQLSFGSTWRELLVFALRVAGYPNAKVTINWKSPATVDDQAGWATVLAKLQAGLPVKQAFREAGYTADQLEDWFGPEDAGNDMPIRLDMLAKMAGALQALSAAAAVGIFTEQELRTVVNAIVGEIGISTAAESNGAPMWEPAGKAPPAQPPANGAGQPDLLPAQPTGRATGPGSPNAGPVDGGDT